MTVSYGDLQVVASLQLAIMVAAFVFPRLLITSKSGLVSVKLQYGFPATQNQNLRGAQIWRCIFYSFLKESIYRDGHDLNRARQEWSGQAQSGSELNILILQLASDSKSQNSNLWQTAKPARYRHRFDTVERRATKVKYCK